MLLIKKSKKNKKKMTRKKFLVHLERNEIGNILSHFYSFRCKELKIQPLGVQDFLSFYRAWKYAQYATSLVLNYYFKKFEIIIIEQQNKKTLYI
jgi:hypothetical protein